MKISRIDHLSWVDAEIEGGSVYYRAAAGRQRIESGGGKKACASAADSARGGH